MKSLCILVRHSLSSTSAHEAAMENNGHGHGPGQNGIGGNTAIATAVGGSGVGVVAGDTFILTTDKKLKNNWTSYSFGITLQSHDIDKLRNNFESFDKKTKV